MADSSAVAAAHGAPKKKTGAILSILLLLVCCALCVWFYLDTVRITSEHENTAPLPAGGEDRAVQAEIQDLNTVSDEYANLIRTTSRAMQTAQMAEAQGHMPVDVESSLARVKAASAPELQLQVEPEIEPPTVTVVAVMLGGGGKTDKIAMINVLGEESGLVVKVGSKFAGGDASITKIDEKGVTFRWMGKTYTAGI